MLSINKSGYFNEARRTPINTQYPTKGPTMRSMLKIGR